MKRWGVPVAVATFAWLLGDVPGWGAVEVIGLKDGHEVTGEVVAEKANALYVDLGFDILRIPRDQVVRRGKPGQAGSPSGTIRASDVDPTGFFTSGPLRPAA